MYMVADDAEIHVEKADLIARLKIEMGYSDEEAERVVDAMMESITESLSKGDKINLPGIGTMAVVERSVRKGEDQSMGRDIKFSPGKRLKDALTSLDFITKGLE
jgi:DNA-binding protein HU-beta